MQFLVVGAQAAVGVQVRFGAVEALAEQAVDLFDAAFVGALFLHHLEQQRQVQRHHRDGRAGLGDYGLQHGDAGVATGGGEFLADAEDLLVQVLLGGADGAVPVQVVGDLFAQVGEGGGLGAVGQHAGFLQGVDPHLPVFTAHDRHGVGDLGLGGRLHHAFLDHFLVGVQATEVDGLADRLEHGVEDFAGLGVGAARGGQAVDHQVDLAQVLLDGLDGDALHLVGERIAVDAARIQALGLGGFLEGGGVVPAGGAGLGLAARTLEEHAQGVGARAEGGGDACGQAVAGGRTDDQHLLRAVGHGAFGLDVADLFLDVGLAAGRMGSDADEATHARFDDHGNLGC